MRHMEQRFYVGCPNQELHVFIIFHYIFNEVIFDVEYL